MVSSTSKLAPDYSFLEDKGVSYQNIGIKPVEIVKTPDISSYPPEKRSKHQAAYKLVTTGDLKQATKAYEKIFQTNPKDIQAGNFLAALLSHNADFTKAKITLEKILKTFPTDVIALNNLACCYIRIFQYNKRTEAVLIKALEAGPTIAETHHNTGVYYHRQNAVNDAAKSYFNALAIKKMPETLSAMGFVCMELNDLSKTQDYFMEALKINKNHAQAYYGLSLMEERLGKQSNSITLISNAFNLEPQNYVYAQKFGDSVKNMLHPIMSDGFKRSILHYLRIAQMRHLDVFAVWANMLVKDGQTPNIADILLGKTKADIPEDDFHILLTELEQEFVWRGLKELIIRSIPLEELFTRIRRYLALNIETLLDDASLPYQFIFALSEQCFFNEYIFDETPEERGAIHALEAHFTNGLPPQYSDHKSAVILALIGAYKPLYNTNLMDICNDISSKSDNPELEYLYTYQIKEPALEHTLKTKIKTFGAMENAVTQDVKAQYEEHPYPRWKEFFQHIPDQKALNDIAFQSKKVKALIAGCGTGKQVLGFLTENLHTHVTAIDISASSISYAQRKMNERDIKNVNFFMGDIMDISALNQRYDHIASTGVLHHMEDPLKGWEALTHTLKPGGTMHIALYSELARESVVAARDEIARLGYTSCIEDMKKMRTYIKNADKDHVLRDLTLWTDFYTTSMLRDLIFHVQEHRFTIPQIQEALKTLGLEFIEFSKACSASPEFIARNNDPALKSDLNAWHVFEEKNPKTFAAMYNFLCKKL